MAALETRLGLAKDCGAQLHISTKWSHVHSAIDADDEALNRTLLGVEAWINGDQATVRLQRVCNRSQQARCKLVVQVMEDSNRDRDIDRGKSVPCEVADEVADVVTDE